MNTGSSIQSKIVAMISAKGIIDLKRGAMGYDVSKMAIAGKKYLMFVLARIIL